MTFERNVDVNGSGSPEHTNAGLLTLANGAVLAFKGTDDFTNLEGGVITGTGTLDFSATGTVFLNEGIIDVAGITVETVDDLQVTGDLTATDSSVIIVDIGNDGDEVGDSLTVTGELTLNGTLEAYFISGYSPVAGDIFNVVNFGTATAGSYFDAIYGLEGDEEVLLDINIDDSANGGVTLTAVANAITATSGSDSYVGSSVADHVYGGDGNDILDGDGGEDLLLGGAGDDVIKISDNAFHFIDGGDGTDTLVARNGLDLTQVRNDIVKGFEVIELGFGALALDADDVMAMNGGTNALTGTENTLIVTRNDFGGGIDIGTGWGAAAATTLTVDGEVRSFDKQVHASTGAIIYIEQAVTALGDLASPAGFQIYGEYADDMAGYQVSSAGDINGDGFADFIIGADFGDRDQTADQIDTGAAYVIFGSVNGLGIIDLGDIGNGDGTYGFKLEGSAYGDIAGGALSALGDVNGDGIDDIIVGAPFADDNAGAAYVIFGKTSGFEGAYNLDTLGSDGFKISGVTSDYAGSSVGSGGDINGDGINDIMIGAPQVGAGDGKSYVVYGSASLGADIAVSALTGIGTEINGFVNASAAGHSVSIVGDINGDGYDEIAISSLNENEAYLLFGKDGGLGDSVDISTLDGNNGFKIRSTAGVTSFGALVAGLGDVNGDGFDDFAVAAPYSDTPAGIFSGSAYVVYGKGAGLDATLDIDDLDGTDGFRIQGAGGNSELARISAAGDINGDGLDDMIIGSHHEDGNLGAAYVVFGSTEGFGADFALADMSGEQGFRLAGDYASGRAGQAVSGAGDINGDGFDDLIVSAEDGLVVDPNSYYGGVSNGAGVSYVVYGGDFSGVVDTTGSVGADVLIGSANNDTLSGEGGADVIRGGAGDDTIGIGDAGFARVDGGLGQDTLYLDGQFDLDLTALSNNILSGIEHINLNNGLMNILDIDFTSVLDIGEAIDNLVGEANMLVVSRDENDTVNLIGNWTEREEQPEAAASQGYTVFDSDESNASVAIQNIVSGGA